MKLYKLLKPYYSLKRWYKLQHDIYSTPKSQRPIFWEIRREMTIAKNQISYDLGQQIYGTFQSQQHPKELDGLEGII